MKTVTIEDATWETLTIMKVKGKYASFDELIQSLIPKKDTEAY